MFRIEKIKKDIELKKYKENILSFHPNYEANNFAHVTIKKHTPQLEKLIQKNPNIETLIKRLDLQPDKETTQINIIK